MLSAEQLDEVSSSSPWFLSARVQRGGAKLTWPELWDVLRWYAHNRGYDGNKGWSRQDAVVSDEDTAKEQKAHELLDAFAAKHGRAGTMAEVFCDVMKVDPLGPIRSSDIRVRNLGAAFPREGVEAEVERILRAHLGVLEKVDEAFITAVLRDHTALRGPEYRLPARYGQRVDGKRTPGGLLFGQLVPRFDNRIIATCPITFQRVRDRVLREDADEARADREATKLAKVPALNCPEFYRFRWAMQLANVQVATGDAKKPKRLTSEQRQAVHAEMEKKGFFSLGTPKHPGDFTKAVRALTGGAKDNLDEMLAQDHADRSLILDPARKFVSLGVLGILWPYLMTEEERRELEANPGKMSKLQRHTLTNLRRGKAVTARALLVAAPAAQAAFDRWWDGEAMKKPRAPRKAGAPEPPPRTRDQALDERHALKLDTGRAPYTREVMREVVDFVLCTDKHPMDEDGPLYRSEAIRHAQLQRAIDEQTNNHLVRHRLKLLERLHGDLLKEYADNEPARVARITIEVNRELKEMSGKTAQEQAKEQGQQTAQFRGVEKKLTAAYEGLGVHLGPGLIRKGRIAEDLAWTSPYTGKLYNPIDLLHRRVDKDHIIPRSQRASDSLDSLVITFSEINKWKGNRTALQFVEEEQGKSVPGLANVMILPLAVYQKNIATLKTFGGHDDDERRRKNRKRLLGLRDYVEKEFTPGDLTKTSQLVRLGAQALQRAYLPGRVGVPPAGPGVSPGRTSAPREAATLTEFGEAATQDAPLGGRDAHPTRDTAGGAPPAAGQRCGPVITSLPGSVTGAVRKSWNLTGCLALANPLVLDSDDLDEDGKPKVHRKTEIRGITHLHHALDACVLALASHLLPTDGATWNREVIQLLAKRRLSAAEQAILRAQPQLTQHIQISFEGEPRIKELDPELREHLRQKLAERRVVQHLPRDLSGMESKETVWRLFDPADLHPNAKRLARRLAKAQVPIPAPEAKTALIICRKRKNADAAEGESAGGKVFHEGKTWRWVYDVKDKSALLGLAPEGDVAKAKLKKLKAVNVLGDNFGIALDPEPTLIRPHKVWHQLEKLREANGGEAVRVLRKGTLISVPVQKKPSPYEGVWMVRGTKLNQKQGILLNISRADVVPSQGSGRENLKENVSLNTLRKSGLEVLKTPLCGAAKASLSAPETVSA